MESGMSDVASILKVELDGLELGFQMGKGTLEMAKKMVLLLASLMKAIVHDSKYIKKYGKTNLSNLIEKTKEAGGFTPLRFETKRQMDEFIRKAGAGILCAPIPTGHGKDGPCYLGVANIHADFAKSIYEECMKEWVKDAVRSGTAPEDARQHLEDENREMAWPEYMAENKFMQLPMQDYESALSSQFGIHCLVSEDLKKTDAESDRQDMIAIRQGIGKAALMNRLQREEQDRNRYISVSFDKDDVFRIDHEGQSCQIHDSTEPDVVLDIPLECIYEDGDRIVAVLPKEMQMQRQKIKGTDAESEPVLQKADDIKAGRFSDRYDEWQKKARENLLEKARRKKNQRSAGTEPADIRTHAPVRAKS